MNTIIYRDCTIETVNIYQGREAMDEKQKEEIPVGRELCHVVSQYDTYVKGEIYKLKALQTLINNGDFSDSVCIDQEVGQGIAGIIEDVTDILDGFWKELDETHDLEKKRMESGALKDPQGYIGATEDEAKERSGKKGLEVLDKIFMWLIDEQKNPDDKVKTINDFKAIKKAPEAEPPSTTTGA